MTMWPWGWSLSEPHTYLPAPWGVAGILKRSDPGGDVLYIWGWTLWGGWFGSSYQGKTYHSEHFSNSTKQSNYMKQINCTVNIVSCPIQDYFNLMEMRKNADLRLFVLNIKGKSSFSVTLDHYAFQGIQIPNLIPSYNKQILMIQITLYSYQNSYL